MPHVMTIDGAPVPVVFAADTASSDPYQAQMDELRRQLKQWQVGTVIGGIVTLVAIVALAGSR